MSKDLEKAIEIARKYHAWQKRKDWSDYIDHPIAVMNFLMKYDFPEEALIAAILHDTCEDTKLNNIDISDIFWSRVAFVVNALSKNKKPKNHKELKKDYEEKQKGRKISNLENFSNFDEYIDYRFHMYLNRLYTWIIADPWIFFIKVADQIDNLSDMKPFTKEKKERKINEIEQYFLPIYKKSEEIFKIDNKNLLKYNWFMNELNKVIEEAKIKL